MSTIKRGNKYRVQKMFNGQRYSVTFDHKPKEIEIIRAFADVQEPTRYGKKTFKKAAEDCINSKENVYSPATVREYDGKLRRLPDEFKNMFVEDITQEDVQNLINEMSAKKSPKTVRDMHAFITLVLGEANPKLVLRTKLPQKIETPIHIPTDEDINKLIEQSKVDSDGMYYIPIMLGIRSLRRSEICGLTIDNLQGNNIVIDTALVQNRNHEWVEKTTKTVKSTRIIPIPEDVANKIREQGYIYNGAPGSISNYIARFCEENHLEHFSLHKLRHFFASRMSAENIDMKTIEKIGGWKSDYTVKRIYAHAVDKKVNEALEKLDDILV